MRDLREIVEVVTTDDFVLDCKMENGEIYRYDMSFVKEKSGALMVPLRDATFFKKVWIDYGALEWPNGFGIHGDTIVRDGKPISKKNPHTLITNGYS